tara:strand:+ start:2814 stop:3185 length:372 start_codon:yes stop_codon:yes gene_type:complete
LGLLVLAVGLGKERIEKRQRLNWLKAQQFCRIQRPAPTTAEYPRRSNAVLPEQITPPRCLQAARLIKIALSRAVLQYETRRIACPRRQGMTHEQNGTALPQGSPSHLVTTPGTTGPKHQRDQN